MKNKGKIIGLIACFVFGSCVREIIPIKLTRYENKTPEQAAILHYFDSVSDARTHDEIKALIKQGDAEKSKMLYNFDVAATKAKLNNYK